jgi:hypothetical protein
MGKLQEGKAVAGKISKIILNYNFFSGEKNSVNREIVATLKVGEFVFEAALI